MESSMTGAKGVVVGDGRESDDGWEGLAGKGHVWRGQLEPCWLLSTFWTLS